MKLFKVYKEVIKESYEEEYDEYDEYDNGGHFKPKLSEDEKRGTAVYKAHYVDWYGTPGKMVSVHKDNIVGMSGNIYDPEKLEMTTELIREYPTKIEFLTSYGLLTVIEFIDIQEQQEANVNDRFELDFDGYKSPATIGDTELDNYIGHEDISDSILGSYIDVPDFDLYEFFNKEKFFLIYGKSVDALKNELTNFSNEKNIELDEDTLNAVDEFIEIERKLKIAVDEKDGDIGKLQIQLRDGHHRVFSAIAAGDDWVCVDLVDADIKRYREAIENTMDVNFVTKLYYE